MSCAFFDLDKTLLACNSASLWVRYELRHGYVTRWQAVQAFAHLLRYKLGATQLDDTVRLGIATLRGSAESALRKRLQHFYETELRQRYRPGAHAAVKSHRERGDQIVLLTSTTQYLAKAVREDLDFDDSL